MKPIGQAITDHIRSFNNWRDDTLIDVSTLLLMIGFIMGTFDILTRIGIATSPWFTGLWAIVQAIAIDGLFFAVWAKIARTSWATGYRFKSTAMVFVGLLLAVVAILINAVLSLQQLTGIADSLQAMAMLHISSIAFVWARAILVVAVALLVQLFCRGKVEQVAMVAAPIAITESHSPTRQRRSPTKAMLIDSRSPAPVAIAEHASIDRGLNAVAMDSPAQGYVAPDVAIITTGNQGYRDRIKSTWLRHREEGRVIQLTEIAADAGVGYSTVKKYAASIREELEQDQA